MFFVDRNILRRAINFAGRSLDKALDAIPSRRLAKMQRALDVGIDKAAGRAIGVRNRNQRGQVEDNIDAAGQFLAEIGVTDVAGDDFDLVQAAGLFEPTPLVERVVLA